MKTKFAFLALFAVLITSYSTYSQDEIPQTKEVYLSTSNPFQGGVGVQFKMPLANNNTYFRMGLMDVHARIISDDAINTFDYDKRNSLLNFATQFGLEKRKSFKKIILFYGVDIYGKYSYASVFEDDPALPTELRKSNRTVIDIGLAFRSGIMYNLNKHLSIAADINPIISYGQTSQDVLISGEYEKDTYKSGDFVFDTSNCWLSLVIHLNK